MISLKEMTDRLLGFLPARQILWMALGTSFLSIIIQMLINWFQSLSILPWMREENQKNREQILGERSLSHRKVTKSRSK